MSGSPGAWVGKESIPESEMVGKGRLNRDESAGREWGKWSYQLPDSQSYVSAGSRSEVRAVPSVRELLLTSRLVWRQCWIFRTSMVARRSVSVLITLIWSGN